MRAILVGLCLLFGISEVSAASRFWVPLAITNAISGTGGLCRLTVNDTTNLSAGITVIVANIVGATACDGTTTVTTVVDATHVEVNLAFGLAYTSGGTVAGGNWTAAGTGNWSASSGGAGGQSVPGSSDTVTFDGSSGGGTVTVNSPNGAGVVTVTSITFGAFTGTLDFLTNSNNVTAGQLGVTGTGVRTINMGNGTWTLTSAALPFDATTKTNLTFNANGSTIVIASVSTTLQTIFTANGLTFNNITVSGNAAVMPMTFDSAFTAATFTVNGPNFVNLNAGSTYTVTTLSCTGSSSAIPRLGSSSTLTNVTISVASGTQTQSWCALRGIIATGGATFTATNSINQGQNTGITISAPTAAGSGCILGGWLFYRDLDPAANDNFPAFVEKAS